MATLRRRNARVEVTMLRTGKRSSPIGLAAAGLAVLIAAGGCTTLPSTGPPLMSGKIPKFQVADAKHPAVEILAIWQPAEGPGRNGVPTRGIAGQVFFFSESVASPVVVNGTVRIYLFDSHGSVQDQGRPIQEYNMSPAVLNGHLQFCSLGPMYQVFLPYPRADYHQAMCSLRIRFTPNVGETIYSIASTLMLPGPPEQSETGKPVNRLSAVTAAPAPANAPAAQWQGPGATDSRAYADSKERILASLNHAAMPPVNQPTFNQSSASAQSGASQPYVFVPGPPASVDPTWAGRTMPSAAAAGPSSREADADD
jgi:hypothetical protein